jgi:hypothetical protein
MHARYALLCAWFATSVAFACSCGGQKTFDLRSMLNAFCSADLVFEGRAYASERLDSIHTLHRIRALRVHRGLVSDSTATISGFPHGPCFHLEEFRDLLQDTHDAIRNP